MQQTNATDFVMLMQNLFQNNLMRLVAKILLFILLWWAIYWQLFSQGNLWDLYLYNFQAINKLYLLIALLLTTLNWSLEALKWRYLLQYIVPMPFYMALYSVLGGVALALFTPNRIGEYGGRIWYLPEDKRWQGIIALFTSNMLQLGVNILFGALGYASYCYLFQFFAAWQWAMFLALGILFVFGILIYLFLSPQLRSKCLNVAFIVKIRQQINNNHIYTTYSQKWQLQKGRIWRLLQNNIKQFIQAFQTMQLHYKASNRYYVGILSCLRYFVYVLQYILLLKTFGAEAAWTSLVLAALSAYFLQTILPTIAILELGIKGNIALFIFLPLLVPASTVLAATLLLWCINLALPALIGAILLAQKK